MKALKIGIIGCGHMGSAIAKALIAKRIGKIFVSNPIKPNINEPSAKPAFCCNTHTLAANGSSLLAVSVPDTASSRVRHSRTKCAYFATKPGFAEGSNAKWTTNNCEAVKNTDIILIAVKPNTVQTVLKEIKPALKPNQILVSIAAGISLKKLAEWSQNHKKIVRAMPNLPVQVFSGISVWKSSGLFSHEKTTVENLLNSFGVNIEVRDENLINIATAIGGGGPAYTAAFLETMSKTAQKIGFAPPDARKLALQSVYGSIIYIQQTGLDFAEIKQAVQTKGGTTEAGFKVLKKNGWQKILEKALLAGYKRACKISK